MYEFKIHKFGFFKAQKYFSVIHETFGILSKNIDLGQAASKVIEGLKKSRYNRHYFLAEYFE
jgi:hypothetical protein